MAYSAVRTVVSAVWTGLNAGTQPLAKIPAVAWQLDSRPESKEAAMPVMPLNA